MAHVTLAHGFNGTGKTTFALSGKGKKWYAEFDPGSYERAISGLFGVDESLIDVHYYHPPLTSLLDFGVLDTSSTGESGLGGIQISHKLSGWVEVYWAFIKDFMVAVKDPEVADIIWDTGKMEWEMARNAMRERVQDETNLDEQRRLQRLDYQEPNMQQHQMMQAAKSNGKNLIIVAHSTEEWAGTGSNRKTTGKWVPDGWNEAGDEADCTLYFRLNGKVPVATVQKGGRGGLDLLDHQIEWPTIPLMNAILDGAAKLRKLGMEVPAENSELLELAAAL